MYGIVPSASFVVDIPEASKDSFYSRKVFACLKDKFCQLSSPIRHRVELSSESTRLLLLHGTLPMGEFMKLSYVPLSLTTVLRILVIVL